MQVICHIVAHARILFPFYCRHFSKPSPGYEFFLCLDILESCSFYKSRVTVCRYSPDGYINALTVVPFGAILACRYGIT